jgi:hypothetical protein
MQKKKSLKLLKQEVDKSANLKLNEMNCLQNKSDSIAFVKSSNKVDVKDTQSCDVHDDDDNMDSNRFIHNKLIFPTNIKINDITSDLETSKK